MLYINHNTIKSYQTFIMESALSRIDHLEDLMFIDHYDTFFDKTKKFFTSLLNKFEMYNSNLSLKWDGSPSIVIGYDSKKSSCFIATKHSYNRKDRQLAYSVEDIKKQYTGKPELIKILSTCLQYIPEVLKKNNITYQADLLFSSPNDLFKFDYNNQNYIGLQPNTIVYGIPEDSELAKLIMSKKIGLVIHTKIKNDAPTSLPKNNTPKNTDNVWVANNVSNKSLNHKQKEKTEIHDLIENIKISGHVKNMSKLLFTSPPTRNFNEIILKYTNDEIRNGIDDITLDRFRTYLKDHYASEIEARKSEQGRKDIKEKLMSILTFLKTNEECFNYAFNIRNTIKNIKLNILEKLAQSNDSIQMFVKKGNQYIPSKGEGYVSNIDRSYVKLVDRKDFTKLNFENPKFKKKE